MSTPYERMAERAGEEFDQKKNDQFSRLVEIFSALPVLEEHRCNIEQFAALFLMEAGWLSINDRPQSIRKGSEQSIDELLTLKKLTKKLADHMHSLNRTAIDAFERHHSRRHRLEIEKDLMSLSMAAWSGIKDLRSAEPIKKIDGRAKHQAAAVTRRAVNIFETLTGLQPSPSVNYATSKESPFVVFLDELYAALGIDAEAASQAAMALKKSPPKR